MSKKVKYVLMLSIALNILFAGFYVGGFIKHEKRYSHIERVPEGLSEASENLFKTEMRALRETGKEKREKGREERRELSRIISAETFDEAAYRAQLDKIQEGHKSMMENHEEAMIRIISGLSFEERKAFAEFLDQRGRRFKK